jgi:mannose-6-phosphate isomerase-like protein (cupin superfamily)
MAKSEIVAVRDRDLDRDSWDDPVKGRIAWRTLFGGDNSKTDSLTAGIAEVEPGGWLGLHRHTPAEIYYVLEGSGIVTIDGREYPVAAGTALFIPGDAEHGLRNEGDVVLRFLYAFAADSFAKVEYRFSKA